MDSIAVSEFELNSYVAEEYYRLIFGRIFGNDLYVITSHKNRVYSIRIFSVKNTKINKYVYFIGNPEKRSRTFIWYRIINFFDEIKGKYLS